MVKRIQGCFRCRYFRIRLTSARSSRWPRLQLRQPLLFGPSPHLSDHFPGPLFLCMRTWHSLAIAEPWQVNGQNLKSSVEIKSIHHATGLAKKTVLAFSFLSLRVWPFFQPKNREILLVCIKEILAHYRGLIFFLPLNQSVAVGSW